MMLQNLSSRFNSTRQKTLKLAEPLSEADMQIQADDFASPSKWHLAHTTWFFEEFVLSKLGFRSNATDAYRFLFNSYYETVGSRQPQSTRGLISRPSLQEILDYRQEVDHALSVAIQKGLDDELVNIIELGIHHEQQHQELFLTDILYNLSQNPLNPAYLSNGNLVETPPVNPKIKQPQMIGFSGGLIEIGHQGDSFCFDNELPAHQVFIAPYRLANQLVTNSDWIAFIEDGGYKNPLLWLADGWKTVQREQWQMPLYWSFDTKNQSGYSQFNLHGLTPLNLAAPVCHVSFFEADAYARWCGKRLPTEAEWEHAVKSDHSSEMTTNPVSYTAQPRLNNDDVIHQLYGDVWQWTASPYVGYPGFKTTSGAVGEYNGKFMNGQYVLRGSSFATPLQHTRISYRNFFYPHQRWQFSGLRLAE